MYLNSEHYLCPTEGKAIQNVMAERKSKKSSNYRYINERKRKHRKAAHSRRKANIRLHNQLRNQNDRFILTWTPAETSQE